MPDRTTLLLEIGTEELPPAMLEPGAAELCRRVAALFEAKGIEAGPAAALCTPRRLAVRVEGVAPEVPARPVEVQGPPRKAAFDAEGRPTKTAAGFSRAHGVTPAELFTRKTDRGEYVFARKLSPAVRTADVLETELPGIIGALPFPRTMRWLEDRTRFPRPIRWLVCLLGGMVVPFRYAGLVAGDRTLGRRGSPGPVEVPSPAEYEPVLEAHGVIVSPARRRDTVISALARIGKETGAEPVLDEGLLEETVDITEFPVPVLCRFDDDYLGLPPEVLVTALKKHQKCFALREPDGALVPRFVAFANTPGCDRALVARWYEDAADSRLRDARFYFEADMRKGLAALVEEEKRVTWFEGMGSYYDKTGRIRRLCAHLAAAAAGVDPARLDRAALLSKADLLTEMVREKEFTSLQGVMGGIYARLQGEDEEVAAAVRDQYRPVGAGDRLPETVYGCLLSIADRTDNVAAAFLSGEVPTGSEDPYGLRRQAAGIYAIILERQLNVDTGRLIDAAVGLFPTPDRERADRLPGFFRERAAQAFADREVPYDLADAVLATTGSLPLHALTAARALIAFRARPEFEKLVIGQKRVANILRDQAVEGDPDPALFSEPAEKELYDRAAGARPAIEAAAGAHDWNRALELLLGLRACIDKLFDEVLVMDKDDRVRQNRLRLLLSVRSLFRRVADLSKVVLEGEQGT